ncbi:hybrid sensor histidine kinase/response regulator [Candidatus Scalindua japonica]|uniref:hybrid sensor histidine kinase/response regulator n=1 Tax=Candidatus Scalindua japonica TaxID=1284222 RepID=UPI0013A596B6|nr:ATP-binding protein [Candidatus Scalindua japonica]
MEQFKERGVILTQNLADNLINPVYKYDMETIYEITHAAKKQKDIKYIYVYDKTGKIIHDGTKDISLFNKNFDEISKTTARSKSLLIQFTADMLDVSTPIMLYDELLGGVRIGLSLSGMRSNVSNMTRQLGNISDKWKKRNLYAIIITALGLSVFGFVLAWLLGYSLIHPLIKLSKAVERVAKGDLSGKIEVKSRDELGDLAISFNKMTENLKKTTVSRNDLINEMKMREKMEEALLQSEKLKSIGTITAGISHEYNNILTIISGTAQLMEMDHKNDKKLAESLGTIKRATDDGAEISRMMYRFTKVDKGVSSLEVHQATDLLKQAIDFTMPRWKSMAQANGINYHLDQEDMKDAISILCNPTEIREVFINIINNALDAMPEGGRLSFRSWNKENAAFISISDSGKGMVEEVQRNIFDPFFTTKRPEGTGLGLSIVYGIITRHGGKIEVESNVGTGSTFTLLFPVTVNKETSIKRQEQEIINKDLHVLIVDDEEPISRILDKFFSRNGNKVKVVNNGADAIELVNREDFNLVLCDIAMPDVFGYDVIKELNRLKKIPKIGIITGWEEKLKPIDEEGLKVDFIIKKPFDFSILEKKINAVIDSRK